MERLNLTDWDAVKALLLENIHPEAEQILLDAGIEVVTEAGALQEDDLIAALQGVSLLGIRSNTHVTRRVIEAASELSAVGCFCIGTNQVDLLAAREAGVAVFNAPYSNTRSVVELAIAEIIALARRLTDRNQQMHSGVWDKNSVGSHEIRGRTLGIVGYGNIGSQLSVVAESLGMQVFYYDSVDKLALGNAKRCDSLAELLSVAEAVSLHVDGRPENARLFGAKQFAQMRPRSLLLNLSRGFVVDQEALRESLLSGHLAGAALDVFDIEPKNAGEPFVSPLLGMPNVILTPHIGGSTQEAQFDIGRFVAYKLRSYLENGSTVMSVNLPQVQLPQTDGVRIAQLHENVPGALARLNAIFAAHGANIAGQSLATDSDMGYVVSDLETPSIADLVTEIEALPETRRVTIW